MMSNSTYADVVSGSKTKVSLMIWHLNCDLWSTVLRLEIEGVRIIKKQCLIYPKSESNGKSV